MLKLHEPCECCNGTGVYKHPSFEDACTECEGTGRVLTGEGLQIGRLIWDAIQKHEHEFHQKKETA
jgi:DnaJ-class molecular chaperone